MTWAELTHGFRKFPMQDDLPQDLDMAEIRGRLREEDYTPYVA